MFSGMFVTVYEKYPLTIKSNTSGKTFTKDRQLVRADGIQVRSFVEAHRVGGEVLADIKLDKGDQDEHFVKGSKFFMDISVIVGDEVNVESFPLE